MVICYERNIFIEGGGWSCRSTLGVGISWRQKDVSPWFDPMVFELVSHRNIQRITIPLFSNIGNQTKECRLVQEVKRNS